MNVFKHKFSRFAAASLLLVSVLSGCKKDFFDLEDQNGINDEGIWNNEGPATLFLNRTYDLIMPNWPTVGGVHNTSDELNNASSEFLYGTLVENSITDIGTGNGEGTNRYFDIRRCNTAIDGINAGTIADEEVRKKLKGQFFFLRAYVYFRLVSLYGGVPLILHPQDLNGEDLNVPRSKTSECIAAIANDLDSAAAYLPRTWANTDIGRITRPAALAFKGRVLLFWASPQFNPTNIVERWENAYSANKIAYDSCVAAGRALLSNYANIWVTEDNAEVLLVRKLDAVSLSPGRGTNNEYVTRPYSEGNGGGSNQPTWNLVQAYTMNNGLPITNASSGYDAIMFWQNRDPRFDMSIAYNGASWPLSGKALRKQWNYTGVLDETSGTIVTGFYTKKITNPTLQASQALYNSNSGGGSGMDWIEMRFAEVIMNLAEAANESGRLSEAKDMVRLIRKRAGIIQGTIDYGMSIATNTAEMRTLIMNERQVEFAMEGRRHWDLRRTRNYGLITGRFAFKWAAKAPYYAGTTRTGALPGDIFLDKADAQGVKPRDTATLNNKSVYTSMFTTSTSTLEGSNVINIPEKYYFYALPNFFNQATYTMEQTKGWTGGTFDPLQ